MEKGFGSESSAVHRFVGVNENKVCRSLCQLGCLAVSMKKCYEYTKRIHLMSQFPNYLNKHLREESPFIERKLCGESQSNTDVEFSSFASICPA